MAAIGKVLDVRPETFLAVHTTDLLVCGLYLLFLLAGGARAFGLVLAPFPADETSDDACRPVESAGRVSPTDVIRALALGVAIVASAAGLSQLVGPESREALLVIAVSTIAFAVSFVPRLRDLPGLVPTGDYLLLVFCLGVGSLASLSRLKSAPVQLLAFTAVVVLGSVVLHVLLCRLFSIDRDTCIITSTAALFGPPFVPPVAQRLENPRIVVPGISSGLVGMAVGTYLGLFVAQMARALLG